MSDELIPPNADEEWRTAAINPTFEVSSLGNVRRTDSKKNLRGGNSKGYRRVDWCEGKTKKSYLIHRMVAEAFIGDANGRQVDHINGIRDDNRPSNLRYCTIVENRMFAVARGTHSKGHAHGSSVLTPDQVSEIIAAKGTGRRFWGTALLAKRFGVCEDTISRVASGETYADAPRDFKEVERIITKKPDVELNVFQRHKFVQAKAVLAALELRPNDTAHQINLTGVVRSLISALRGLPEVEAPAPPAARSDFRAGIEAAISALQALRPTEFPTFKEDDDEAILLYAISKLEALAPPAGAGEWQPMDTAPKDGTEIIGYRPDQGVFVFRWAWMEEFVPKDQHGDPTEPYDEDFACWWHDRWDWMEGELTPTLWQPLPSPPKGEEL